LVIADVSDFGMAIVIADLQSLTSTRMLSRQYP
jgi:hypothetical protein